MIHQNDHNPHILYKERSYLQAYIPEEKRPIVDTVAAQDTTSDREDILCVRAPQLHCVRSGWAKIVTEALATPYRVLLNTHVKVNLKSRYQDNKIRNWSHMCSFVK